MYYSKQEQEKQHRFGLVGDGNVKEVSDEDAGQEGCSDNTEPEAAKLQSAEKIPNADSKEHGHFGILFK